MNPNFAKIETDRLLLRPFTLDDIEPSYELNLDPEVSRYTADGGIVSKDEIEKRIIKDVLGDYQKYGYGRFAVEEKASGHFIGFAGLKYLPDMEETDLGYRFMRSYWGQGLATEAGTACLKFGFDSLHLQRIIALVLPQNIASIRVLEKLAFKYELEIEADGNRVQQYAISRIPK